MNLDTPAVNAALDRAAFSPALWPAALEHLRAALNARLVMIIRAYEDGVEALGPPELAEAHMERYQAGAWRARDPRGVRLFDIAPMQILTDTDVVAPEDLKSSDFYRDFAVEEDVPHAAFWRVNDGAQDYAFSAVFSRDHGPASASDLASLRALQHRTTASMILSGNLQYARDQGVLDGLAAAGVAALALGEGGKVLEATPLGQVLLEHCFTLQDGRLTARDPQAALALRKLNTRLARVRSDLEADAFVIPRPGQRGVLCLPVFNAGAGLDIFRTVRGVLILKDLDAPKPCQANLLQALYGLTPAEIEVAHQVAAGLSPETISQTRNVAITTTRAILRAIFHKTGVTRQSELSALLARLS